MSKFRIGESVRITAKDARTWPQLRGVVGKVHSWYHETAPYIDWGRIIPGHFNRLSDNIFALHESYVERCPPDTPFYKDLIAYIESELR